MPCALGPARRLRAFPTRRSSDLVEPAAADGRRSCRVRTQCAMTLADVLQVGFRRTRGDQLVPVANAGNDRVIAGRGDQGRSEGHTSELQSPCNLVCRPLPEKKKK